MSPNRQSFRPPAGVTDKPSAALLPHDNESFRRTTNPFTQTTNPSHKRQIHPHKRQKSGHPSGYPDFPIVFRLNGKLHFLAHVGLLGNLRSGNLGRFGSCLLYTSTHAHHAGIRGSGRHHQKCGLPALHVPQQRRRQVQRQNVDETRPFVLERRPQGLALSEHDLQLHEHPSGRHSQPIFDRSLHCLLYTSPGASRPETPPAYFPAGSGRFSITFR